MVKRLGMVGARSPTGPRLQLTTGERDRESRVIVYGVSGCVSGCVRVCVCDSLAPAFDDASVLLGPQRVAGRLRQRLNLTGQVVAGQ